MRKVIHATAGTGALLLVSTFWLSTVISELSDRAVAALDRADIDARARVVLRELAAATTQRAV